MMVHNFNCSRGEAKAGGALCVPCQPGLSIKFQLAKAT